MFFENVFELGSHHFNAVQQARAFLIRFSGFCGAVQIVYYRQDVGQQSAGRILLRFLGITTSTFSYVFYFGRCSKQLIVLGRNFRL